MHNRWVQNQFEEEAIHRLVEDLNFSKKVPPATAEIYARLCLQRGLKTAQEVSAFFNPSLEQLHDPFLMKDMDKACSRLQKAIEWEEKIMIYGDYDVDGTTSVALMYLFLKEHHPHLICYIPDRYTEGYGLSQLGVKEAEAKGVTLLIALDCGITGHQSVELANELGIDVIICDHHLPKATLPEAFAILDPKRSDCNYPFKELSGCGVGFKLLQALCKKEEIPYQNLFKFLDLLCISIAADIVPMVGENRILAHFGLHCLNRAPQIGVAALKQASGFRGEYFISDVVFKLSPRINAAGRLQHGMMAVNLLIEQIQSKAENLALELQRENTNRQSLDKQITLEALEMISADPQKIVAKTTVLASQNWHKGVVGIVASRLIENFYRPTIVLVEENGILTGSARSVRGFDVHQAIGACETLLDNFGGHKYAAGLSLKSENLEAFQEMFEKVVATSILPEMLIPEISYDAELKLGQIEERFYNSLQRFRPFGPGNPKPVFMAKGLKTLSGTRPVGKTKPQEHLRLKVRQDTTVMEGIGFGLAKKFRSEASNWDLIFTIDENNYMPIGNPNSLNLQLNVKDLAPSEV